MKSNDSITKQKTQSNSSIDTAAIATGASMAPPEVRNPYFHDANRAASELFSLLREGLPTSAVDNDDRLRLEAIEKHAENEIHSLADGFSAIGTLVSLSGQVADDAGISGITLIRIGILIDHLAVTLDAVNELRSDAAFTLSQAARGAA